MSRTGRNAALVYGIVCYAIFFVTFLYLIGWLTNLLVPVSIDAGTAGNAFVAVAVDVALIALFGLQHSVMARPGFKRAWTRIVPPAIERPTYVLASSAVFIATFALWQPIPAALWRTEGVFAAVLLAGGLLGFGIVLYSTFLIDHFDLFGLRQAWFGFRGVPFTPHPFATPGLYAHVRHPIYVSWAIIFWATPTMSAGRLLFAAVATAYMVVAVFLEERDLLRIFGDAYRRYQESTPKYIPRFARRRAAVAASTQATR
jgi:methanethiol S-methyltransferase